MTTIPKRKEGLSMPMIVSFGVDEAISRLVVQIGFETNSEVAFVQNLDELSLAFSESDSAVILVDDSVQSLLLNSAIFSGLKNAQFVFFILISASQNGQDHSETPDRFFDVVLKPFSHARLIFKIKHYLHLIENRQTMEKYLDLLHQILDNLNDDNSSIIKDQKRELIKNIYGKLYDTVSGPLHTILEESFDLSKYYNPHSPEYKISKEVEHCAVRLKNILSSLANMNTIVLEDYIQGVPMVNLQKSSSL